MKLNWSIFEIIDYFDAILILKSRLKTQGQDISISFFDRGNL